MGSSFWYAISEELFWGSYFWGVIFGQPFFGSYLWGVIFGGLFLASYFSGAISGELFLGAISGKYVKSSHLDMIRHKRKGARWARAVLVSENFAKICKICQKMSTFLQNFTIF